MISASFNVNEDDALALASHYYSTSPTVRRTRLWAHLSVPLLMSFLGIVIYCQSSANKGSVIPVLGWGLIWALFYPKYHAWHLVQTAKKMFEESSYHKAFGPYSVTFDNYGIMSSSPSGEGKYPWSSVTRVLLTADHLLIFLAGPQGYSIPRDQVPDATIQVMKAFAESRIPGTEPGAPPNGGATTRLGKSRVQGGPPSRS
jgi:hypothetical protein